MSDKIIETLQKVEDVEHRPVSLQTCVLYLKTCGVHYMAAIVLVAAAFSTLRVGSNFWLGYWSNDWKTNSTYAIKMSEYRLSVFIGLGLGQGISCEQKLQNKYIIWSTISY